MSIFPENIFRGRSSPPEVFLRKRFLKYAENLEIYDIPEISITTLISSSHVFMDL